MPLLGTFGSGSKGGFGRGGLSLLIEATGGTIEEIGDYRVHTFTSSGTFEVQSIDGALPSPAKAADYIVVAGGGAGGYSYGGGGGAGGFREAHVDAISGTYTASPLATSASMPIAVTSYPITVGAGAAQSGLYQNGQNGGTSTFSTISASGGGGGGGTGQGTGNPGGSGGGGGKQTGAGNGSGNTGGYSPPEGNPGGPGSPNSGGGGGATASGTAGNASGVGGAGAATQISLTSGLTGPTGGTRYYAGGAAPSQNPTGGGVGGGGNNLTYNTSTPQGKGVPGTGGGGKGDFLNEPLVGGTGVVIIRYKYK
tara:strand:+ start:67 stop:996 length:930 start_codon:yes stop_codon:yes gene_type:complete